MNCSIFWAIFQSFCNHEIFVQLNLPIFVVLYWFVLKWKMFCNAFDLNLVSLKEWFLILLCAVCMLLN